MVNKWWRVETGHSRWTWLFGGCNVVMGINTIAIFRIAWNWASIKHRIDKLPFMTYFQKIPAKFLLVCSWWLSTKKYSNTWWNLTSWIYVYCNVQKLIFLTHFSINQNYWFWHVFFFTGALYSLSARSHVKWLINLEIVKGFFFLLKKGQDTLDNVAVRNHT